MRKLHPWILAVTFACLLAGEGFAGIYQLKDGTSVTGDPVSFNAQGLTLKEETGKFLPRIPWQSFSQDALKELLKDPRAQRFVQVLIEVPPEVLEAELPQPVLVSKRVDVVLKPVPEIGRPPAGAGLFGALFGSGGGMLLLFLVYAGSLYAAYEVALFRQRRWPVVLAISAAAPVISPIVFICLPTVRKAPEGEAAAPATAEHPAPHGHGHAHPAPEAAHAEAPVYVEPPPAPAYEAPVAAPVELPPTQVFKRGEFNINRRFIEIKLAGFFRMVRSDAERDLILVMKTARGEYVGNRIANITSTDLRLEIHREGAIMEETFPINDIFEIRVKHKDAAE